MLAVLLSGICLSGDVFADRGERRGGFAGFDRFMVPGGPRDDAQRDAFREEQRRQQRRMSDEQRQQLRRDIDQAGRDIYRRPPRRFRDQ